MAIRTFGDVAYYSDGLGLTSVKQCTEGAVRFSRKEDHDSEGSFLFAVAVYLNAEGRCQLPSPKGLGLYLLYHLNGGAVVTLVFTLLIH